jgi:glutamate-5-semialdehyde dehydrogenase
MSSLRDQARLANAASRELAVAPTEVKVDALHRAARAIRSGTSEILAANRQDLSEAGDADLGSAAMDRLALDEARIESMAAGLGDVAQLGDPVGLVAEQYKTNADLDVQKVHVPLGVVAVIYENRPNVTSDAAGLCLMSGNAALLRGSSGAKHSNAAIADLLVGAVEEAGLPGASVSLVRDNSREAATELMRLDGLVDCLIPRGGRSLIASIKENATVPAIIDGDGNCHVYIDKAADLAMAKAIVKNAKTSRYGVCNAAESLLLHREIAESLLPELLSDLAEIEFRGDERACSIAASRAPGSKIVAATDEDFATEFLGPVMSVGVVDDLDGAVDHIARYGTGHSEAIVTSDDTAAQQFCQRVDAAAVLVNASTRFVDGGQLGLGAEIGISTQKLHARGPLGLKQLTTLKYVINGSGQIR